MVAGAVILVFQVVLIVLLGLLLGLNPVTGFPGILLVLAFAFIWGMAFAGYAVFIALRTRSAAAAQAATFAFFPLLFLSSTFVPKEFITAEWLKIVATVNPTTYVYDGMRSLLNTGWEWQPLLVGFAVVLAFATLTGVGALWQAGKSTRLVN